MTNARQRLAIVFHSLLPDDYADDAVMFLEDMLDRRLQSGRNALLSHCQTGMDALGILVCAQMGRLRLALENAFFRPANRDTEYGRYAWCKEYAEIGGTVTSVLVAGAVFLYLFPSLVPSSSPDSGDFDVIALLEGTSFIVCLAFGWFAFVRGEFAALALFFLYYASTLGAALVWATFSFLKTGVWPDPRCLDGSSLVLIKACLLTSGAWVFHRKLKLRMASDAVA